MPYFDVRSRRVKCAWQEPDRLKRAEVSYISLCSYFESLLRKATLLTYIRGNVGNSDSRQRPNGGEPTSRRARLPRKNAFSGLIATYTRAAPLRPLGTPPMARELRPSLGQEPPPRRSDDAAKWRPCDHVLHYVRNGWAPSVCGYLHR